MRRGSSAIGLIGQCCCDTYPHWGYQTMTRPTEGRRCIRYRPTGAAVRSGSKKPEPTSHSDPARYGKTLRQPTVPRLRCNGTHHVRYRSLDLVRWKHRERAAKSAALQLEHDSQGCINLSKLIEAEVPDVLAKAAGVHGGGLLNQHPDRASIKQDLWAEAGGSRGCRGRCNQERRQRQGFGLNDDGEAWAALLVAAARSWCPQPVDITTHAASPCRGAPVQLRLGPPHPRQGLPLRRADVAARGNGRRRSAPSAPRSKRRCRRR